MQGRIFFSHSTRNICCWEHPQSVVDPEVPFTGLWMELCGGWNYENQDRLPELTPAECEAVTNNVYLRTTIPPGDQKIETQDAAEVLMALNPMHAARTQSGSHRSPENSDTIAAGTAAHRQPLAGSLKRPITRVLDDGDIPQRAHKVRRPDALPHAVPGDRKGLSANGADGAGANEADGQSVGASYNTTPLPPLSCSVEERNYISYALRNCTLPILVEASASQRCSRILPWMREYLASLHPALECTVLDAHVVRFGTSVFLEHWKPHPELVVASRATLAGEYSLPPHNSGDDQSGAGEVWVLLPELISMLVAHVTGGSVLCADSPTQTLPRVFPSQQAAQAWRVLKMTHNTLMRLQPSQCSPRLAVAAAKLQGALERIERFGKGERVVFLGDRGSGKSLLLNCLLQTHLHDSWYTCAAVRTSPLPFMLYREALEHIVEEQSLEQVGVSIEEIAACPDVDIVAMPADYVTVHSLRTSVQQAMLYTTLEEFAVSGSLNSLSSFLLPVQSSASSQPSAPALRISISHAHFPHVLVTYSPRTVLQESAHIYLQKMADEVQAGRVPKLGHFRPSSTDNDAIEAKHSYTMLCGETIQLDDDSRLVLMPKDLVLLPEVEAVAGARRVFHGLGLDLSLDIAWIRDMLRLLLGHAGAESASLCACLLDDDDAMDSGELRWLRQAAAVQDVHVFLPCTLLSNGTQFIEAPAADSEMPREVRAVRDALSEASTVVWLVGEKSLALHNPAAHHLSVDFLPSLLPGKRATTPPSAAVDAPVLLPQLAFPPQRRLVALHWQDILMQPLPTVTGGSQSCRLTASLMMTYHDFIRRRDETLVASTQQQLQVCLHCLLSHTNNHRCISLQQYRIHMDSGNSKNYLGISAIITIT